MKKIYKNPFFSITLAILIAIFFFSQIQVVFAKTDLSIIETDVTLSKNEPLDGEMVRIYARIQNTGEVDTTGNVVFLDNNKEISNPQPISVRANTYDDVFIDWKAVKGNHNIKVGIVELNPKDDNLENNSTIKKDIFVDIDTDKDNISDTKDTDADNDKLTNEEEAVLGTDPLNVDTDGDGVADNVDAFPRDKTESRDTDGDALGDNKDIDDDGDGILDQDEIYVYGSNPLNTDSDGDSLSDKKELEIGTVLIKLDTDGDGSNDFEDKYPLDPTKFQASLVDSIAGFFGGNKTNALLALGIPSALILFFLFFGRKKKRR